MSFLFNGKKEVEGECGGGGYPFKHLEGLELYAMYMDLSLRE